MKGLSIYFRSEDAGRAEKPLALLMMAVMMVTILMTKNNSFNPQFWQLYEARRYPQVIDDRTEH